MIRLLKASGGLDVTAEVSSLTRLTNDASKHQFLAQMPKAKVS